MASASHLWRKHWPERCNADQDLRALNYTERGIFDHLLDLMWCSRDAPNIRNDDIYIVNLLNRCKLSSWTKTKSKLLSLGLISETPGGTYLESKWIQPGFISISKWICKQRDAGLSRQAKPLETKNDNSANAEHTLSKRSSNAQPPQEAKNKNKNKPPIIPLFEEFYKNYPRKVGRPAAERAWRKLNINSELSSIINISLEKWKSCEQWRNLEFVPHPATWLNQRRWEDEPAAGARRDRVGSNSNNNGHYVTDARYCSNCDLPQMSSVCIRCGAELLANSQTLFGDI